MSSVKEMRETVDTLGRTHPPPADDEVLVPRLSLKERDRRYRLVRRAMAKRGIDVLVLPANHGRWDQLMADSRYLSSIGGYGTETLTIFPLEGEVTSCVFNRSPWWRRSQNWVADVRDCRNRWADSIIEKFGEMGFSKGRIGISCLEGLVRAPDGVIPYTTVKRIAETFPNCEIVDVTGMMQDIRMCKSAEELKMMTRSVRIIEKMLDAMAKEAVPGNTEKHLYATLVSTLLENHGELPSLLIFDTGPGTNSGNFVPTDRVLLKGDMIIGEMEARYNGYSGQVVQPMSIGPQRKSYMDALDVSIECFYNVLDKMRPGTSLGTLMDTYERTIKKAGLSRYKWFHPMMHARGLGDERPAQFGNVGLKEYRRIPLKQGMTFVLKPRARQVRGKRVGQIGDTVAITRNGAKRLGKRKLELVITG
jgi:Xaa-Pro aminopeptidase